MSISAIATLSSSNTPFLHCYGFWKQYNYSTNVQIFGYTSSSVWLISDFLISGRINTFSFVRDCCLLGGHSLPVLINLFGLWQLPKILKQFLMFFIVVFAIAIAQSFITTPLQATCVVNGDLKLKTYILQLQKIFCGITIFWGSKTNLENCHSSQLWLVSFF